MRARSLALGLAVTLSACGPAREDVAAKQASAAARQLGGALLTELTTALQNGSPANAINVCGDVAQRISKQISDERGFRVGRTSLRVRNAANAPDAWERSVMENWSRREATVHISIEHAADADRPVLRWISPIRTVGLCTKCHGQEEGDIDEATRAALAERYPDDEATGFAVGDIRGAFTVTVPLD